MTDKFRNKKLRNDAIIRLRLTVGRKIKFLHTVYAGQEGKIERVNSNNMLVVRSKDDQLVPVFYESIIAI